MLAIQLLGESQLTAALDLLQRSEDLAEDNPCGLALTYNNLGCYYRKIGQFRSALLFLEKALEIESDGPQTAASADTHLNTCAVLS
jgi:tetratricopeptide (TPR) repeat protein